MYNNFLKHTVFVLFVFFIAGCSGTSINDNDEIFSNKGFAETHIGYYCPTTDSWLCHQKDPYTLENFQEAYDALASSVTTKSSYDDLQQGILLKATHYAVKFYPKDEEELTFLEGIEDIKISYIPFDYHQAAVSDMAVGGSLVNLEENPHKITNTNILTSSGRLFDQESISLPVLYAVWPVNKSIPESIDYKIDYEVFLPKYAISTKSGIGLSDRILKLIERKAVSLATGLEISGNTRMESPDSVDYKTLSGSIVCQDSYSNRSLPLSHLLLVFQLGSNIEYAETSTDGSFNITAEIPDGAQFKCRFSNNRWAVYYPNGSGPMEASFGEVSSFFENGSNTVQNLNLTPSVNNPALEIHRAANFYFNETHDICGVPFRYPLRIYSYSTSNSNRSILGETYFPQNAQPYLKIYNWTDYNNEMLGTIFHELGHTYHLCKKESLDQYLRTQDFIIESFGCFAGWHLTRQYYEAQLGMTIAESICIDARQDWSSSGTLGNYSPLFVDLIDSFNQSLLYSGTPVDNIQGVPYSLIDNIVTNAVDWDDVKTILDSGVGVYYSRNDLENYLVQFNNYFSI